MLVITRSLLEEHGPSFLVVRIWTLVPYVTDSICRTSACPTIFLGDVHCLVSRILQGGGAKPRSHLRNRLLLHYFSIRDGQLGILLRRVAVPSMVVGEPSPCPGANIIRKPLQHPGKSIAMVKPCQKAIESVVVRANTTPSQGMLLIGDHSELATTPTR